MNTTLDSRDSSPPWTAVCLGLGLALVAIALVFVTVPMWIFERPVSAMTHLVGTFGVSGRGAARYVAIVLALFAAYGGALWLVLTRRAYPPAWSVLAMSGLACLVLAPTHPLTSADVFNYIASARVFWVYGANPLITPPAAFPADPFLPLLGFWQELPSPYGPLWSLLTGGPMFISGDSPLRAVLGFKALSIGAMLGASWLLYLTARRMRPESGLATLLAFSWNPLVIWHTAGNGHNDTVLIFFIALGLYCVARGWVVAAIVALTASLLVKYATALFLPALALWWWRSKSRPSIQQLALGTLAGAGLVALTYAPFWAGWDTLQTTLNEGSYFTVSTAAALRGALAMAIDPATATTVVSVLLRVAFLVLLVVALLRLRGDRMSRLAEAGFYIYFGWLLLAATYFAPWYVLWPLVFAVLLPFRRDILWPALTLSLTSMAVLVAAVWFRERFAPDPRGDWYGMHLAAALAVFPLPVLVWFLALRYPPTAPSRRAELLRDGQRRASRPSDEEAEPIDRPLVTDG